MKQESEHLQADLEGLIDRYGNIILRFCYLYLLDLEQAQQAVQDVFVRVYAHRDYRFDEKKLLRIAVHQCRKRALQHTPCTESAENLILSAFHSMTSMEREIVLLHYYMGLALADSRIF